MVRLSDTKDRTTLSMVRPAIFEAPISVSVPISAKNKIGKRMVPSWLDPHPYPHKSGIDLDAANRNISVELDKRIDELNRRDYKVFLKTMSRFTPDLKWYRCLDRPLTYALRKLVRFGNTLDARKKYSLCCTFDGEPLFIWQGDTILNETLVDNPKY